MYLLYLIVVRLQRYLNFVAYTSTNCKKWIIRLNVCVLWNIENSVILCVGNIVYRYVP